MWYDVYFSNASERVYLQMWSETTDYKSIWLHVSVERISGFIG